MKQIDRKMLRRLVGMIVLLVLHPFATVWMAESRAVEVILAGGLSVSPVTYVMAAGYVAVRFLVVLILPGYFLAWLWLVATKGSRLGIEQRGQVGA